MNENSINASTDFAGGIARVGPAGHHLAFIHPLRSAVEGGCRMTAYYGCSANIPLSQTSEAIEPILGKLRTLLEGAEEARIEKESDSDGVVWLKVQCPEQNYAHGFIADLESWWTGIAPHALEGFAVEYVYENQQGADFFGPTPEALALARRRWNFGKAAYYLEREGIDIRRLLEIDGVASAMAVIQPSIPIDGTDYAIAAGSLNGQIGASKASPTAIPG